MKLILSIITLFLLYNINAQNIVIPDFLDKSEVENFDCKCLEKEVKYDVADQKYVDILWEESLKYLEAYAVALTTSVGDCIDSDLAIYETVDGLESMCIMKQRDMQLMIKHIYLVLLNPDKAKRCFAARGDVDWLYSPGGVVREGSEVDKWLKRKTFKEFFTQDVEDAEVRNHGLNFTANFNKMITGESIKMPMNFPYDISANALPNLWAAVGWSPMYAEDNERNKKNFKSVRGGYAYGEIFGHWGLLRIEEINGEKVGAEVGMVVQAVDTFYPYHNHAISEMYYTITQPNCSNQFQTFAVESDNDMLETVMENDSIRQVRFDSGVMQEYRMWSAGAANSQPLVYFNENTIHAFDVNGNCDGSPNENALVTVWARSNAHVRKNDYGTTRLCESAKFPGTPGKRGEVIQCDLTKPKW